MQYCIDTATLYYTFSETARLLDSRKQAARQPGERESGRRVRPSSQAQRPTQAGGQQGSIVRQ
jgi:hypothetical protein